MSKQSIKFYEELDALLRCEGLMLYDFGGGCTVVPMMGIDGTPSMSHFIAIMPVDTTGYPFKIMTLGVSPFPSLPDQMAGKIIDEFDHRAILIEAPGGVLPKAVDYAAI